MKKEKMGTVRRIIDNNIFSLKFMWKYSRPYLILCLLNAFVGGLIGPAGIILSSTLFNRLDEGTTFAEVLSIIGMMAAITVIWGLWQRIYGSYIASKYQNELHYRVQRMLFEKARTVMMTRSSTMNSSDPCKTQTAWSSLLWEISRGSSISFSPSLQFQVFLSALTLLLRR